MRGGTDSDVAAVGTLELNEDDVSFEEQLKRNPLDLQLWLEYLGSKRDATPPVRIEQ